MRGFCELPEEIHLLIFSYLPFEDLLNFREVSTQFRSLVDNNNALWANSRLYSLWPTDKNFPYMERASSKGNIEAAVKLGLTFLYAEKLDCCKSMSSTSAASHFLTADRLAVEGSPPFSWIFYGPRWDVPLGKCKKGRLTLAVSTKLQFSRQAAYCYAKILARIELDTEAEQSVAAYRLAERLGCWNSTFELIQIDLSQEEIDNSKCVKKLRELVLAHPNCTKARAELCGRYMEGHHVGLDRETINAFTRSVFKFTPKIATSKYNSQCRQYSKLSLLLGPGPRHTLVDWLANTIFVEGYDMYLLHVVVQIIERYLKLEEVDFSKLHLLKMAALVLAARISESVFLPEIEDFVFSSDLSGHVVKSMGDIIGTLKGKLIVLTSDDYLGLLIRAEPMIDLEITLAEYLIQVALLYSEFEALSYSETTAAAFVLSRIVNGQMTDVWPESLCQYTGFALGKLVEPILLLYLKCYFVNEYSEIKRNYGFDFHLRASSLRVSFGGSRFKNVGIVY